MFANGTRLAAQIYCKLLRMFAEGTRLAAQIYCKLLRSDFGKGTRLTVIAQVYANYSGCLLTDCTRLSHQGQPELLHLHRKCDVDVC